MYERDLSISVDQQGGREDLDSAVKLIHSFVSEGNRMVDPLLVDVRIDGFPAFLVHGHAEDREPRRLKLSFELDKPGNLGFAR